MSKAKNELAGLLGLMSVGGRVEAKALVDKLEELVDERIRQHAENAPHLYSDGSAG